MIGVLIVCLLGALSTYGQSADEWIDIVSDDESVSFTLPAASLVHREKERIRIFYGSADAEITVTVEDREAARKYVKSMKRSDKGVSGEDTKDFSIRRYEFVRDDSYRLTIYYGTADTFITIAGSGDKKGNQAIERSFSSLKLPFAASTTPAAGPAATRKKVKYSQLATSREVAEALAVPDAPAGIVSYGKVKRAESGFDTRFSRRLVVISRPSARYTDEARRAGKEGSIPAEVQFLGNGQIGYIRISPSLDPSLAANVAEAVRRIKFVPARVNGAPVDVVQVFVYNFHLY